MTSTDDLLSKCERICKQYPDVISSLEPAAANHKLDREEIDLLESMERFHLLSHTRYHSLGFYRNYIC